MSVAEGRMSGLHLMCLQGPPDCQLIKADSGFYGAFGGEEVSHRMAWIERDP